MDIDADRRRRILRYMLLGFTASALLVLILMVALPPHQLAASGIEDVIELRRAAAAVLAGCLVFWLLWRYVSLDVTATLLLVLITVAVGLADTPYHVVQGRSMFWFALPIVAACILLRSWASFAVAGVCCALLLYVGLSASPPMANWFAMIGFFMLALIAWLSASTLERALLASRDLSQALVASEERYRSIFEHSLSGIGLHEVVRDAAGTVVDYRFLDVNQAFEQQTGLSAQEIVGRTTSEALPNGATNQSFIEIFGRVVDSGKAMVFEQYSEPLDRTYAVSAFPIDQNRFATDIADVSARKQHEAEREALLGNLRRQTEEMRLLMDTVPVGVIMLADAPQMLMVNAIAQELLDHLGRVEDGRLLALAGQPLEELLAGPAQRYWHRLSVANRVLEIAARPVERDARPGWVLVIRDVTQEHDFERRLQQQDRLAVIGQLAGGIAHDFNNLLTTILGFSEFALEGVQADSVVYADVAEVRAAALRAASLTQQLLAFSRRQLLQPRVISLSETIQGMQRMLAGLLEEAIELQFELDPDLASIRVDPVQAQQVIMNLCVNARDAMPQGGRLTIAARNVAVNSPAQPPHLKIMPGRYVMLSISDTGTGMNDEVLAHLYEPFYTTKEVGKGTGLGLATVYGIVRQSEGQINVSSVLGQGTTFRVYFRPAQEGTSAAASSEDAEALPRGSEVILLVEDEAAVRRLARRELESLGYTVLEAGRPSVALALSRAAQHIDLLLTDVVMPEMDGAAVASKIREQWPGLRVLYVSGYTDRNLDKLVTPGAKARFLEKPYDIQQLAEMVRAVLDMR